MKGSSVAGTVLCLHCSVSPHDRESITLFLKIRKMRLREAKEPAHICEINC